MEKFAQIGASVVLIMDENGNVLYRIVRDNSGLTASYQRLTDLLTFFGCKIV